MGWCALLPIVNVISKVPLPRAYLQLSSPTLLCRPLHSLTILNDQSRLASRHSFTKSGRFPWRIWYGVMTSARNTSWLSFLCWPATLRSGTRPLRPLCFLLPLLLPAEDMPSGCLDLCLSTFGLSLERLPVVSKSVGFWMFNMINRHHP